MLYIHQIVMSQISRAFKKMLEIHTSGSTEISTGWKDFVVVIVIELSSKQAAPQREACSHSCTQIPARPLLHPQVLLWWV